MNKKVITPLFLLLFIISVLSGCVEQPPVESEPGIMVIGLNNEVKKFTHTQIMQVPSVSGEGAFLKTTGTIVGPFTYNGANFTALLESVTNITEDFSIEAIATDGYKFTYTKDQVLGKVPLYNDEGAAIGYGGPDNVTLTLIYEEGGQAITEETGGPYRLAYIGPNAPITDGHFWTKFVGTIAIKPGIPSWSISLSGLTYAKLELDDFDSIVYCGDQVHNLSYQYSEDGRIITYEGMPLWVALSIIDGGENETNHYNFNDELAQKGYNVKIFSSEGTQLTLTSNTTSRNNSLILAHVRNNLPLPEDEFPVRLISPDLPKEKWISKITAISITDISGFEFNWSVTLTNTIDSSYSTELTAKDYLSIISCPHHHQSLLIAEEDGTNTSYEGLPLYIIISIFDGADVGTHYGGFNYSFNEGLASSGYTIRVIAADDYSWDFNSSDINNNINIIVAYLRNGAPLDPDHSPLRIIGIGFEGKQMVSAIKEIQIIQ